jgi:hypothetical protein
MLLQAAALDMCGWLANTNEGIALPAAIHIVACALRSLVPGAEDPAGAQKCGIISSGMDLLCHHLAEGTTSVPCGQSCAARGTPAGASSAPAPQWQTDALDLAIRILEHIGAPHGQACLVAVLWVLLPSWCWGGHRGPLGAHCTHAPLHSGSPPVAGAGQPDNPGQYPVRCGWGHGSYPSTLAPSTCYFNGLSCLRSLIVIW